MVQKPKADYLIEVSWEVCNKVGGIYTVITSKLDQLRRYYADNYLLIGPFISKQASGVFVEELPPENMRALFKDMEGQGMICHYGKWLVDTEPNVILIDFVPSKGYANIEKQDLWNEFKIDSLRTGPDYDDPVIWGFGVGKLISGLAKMMQDRKIVCHFHEWLAGVPLLMIKKNKINAATVFTTHATILGRTLASNNFDLYGSCAEGKVKIETIDPLKEAYNYYIEAKYGIERQCAENADIFTTVSEITGMEAGCLLKKKPDVLLPNGLDMKRFPTFEEVSVKHNVAKAQIKEFLLTYFFPYYTFDLDETLIYFLAGRYEFRDKGIDIYIKSLGELNKKMKQENAKKTIVAFIWVPTQVRGIKPSLLENRTFYNDVKETVDESTQDIQKKLLYYLAANIEVSSKNLFDEEVQKDLKIKLLRFKKQGSPEICTHDLYDENDEIKRAIRDAGLNNTKDDKVKIVYYPIYLSGADNLLDTDYHESMVGSHLGVFPSLYEPWGYTPMEAGALGCSAVTTDLAGFGRFIDKKKSPDDKGIFVLKRLNKKDDEIVKSLTEFMFWFQDLDKYDRVQNKIDARNLASMADWKILIENYVNAHNLAIKKKFGM